MDILKLKLPLKIYLPKPVKKGGGYMANSVLMEEIDFNSINSKDIEELEGQYDWIEAWHNSERDKKFGGFDNEDVKMEVVYDKGNYIITLVSEKPFDTIVKNNRYHSPSDLWEDVTLKEAIMRFLEGCIWDGIGENEIGQVTYQNYKCDVWMCGDGLMEM